MVSETFSSVTGESFRGSGLSRETWYPTRRRNKVGRRLLSEPSAQREKEERGARGFNVGKVRSPSVKWKMRSVRI